MDGRSGGDGKGSKSGTGSGQKVKMEARLPLR